MRKTARSAIFTNPVLVGAVTILVAIVAVFLAYTANKGLPFVPTVQLTVVVPDAYKLVAGNEVREGGFRIGVVAEITPRRLADRTAGAALKLKLDKAATPIPADSTVRIRPRSTLGLKYVELQRGRAADTLPDGSSIAMDERALTIELEDFFEIFDADTRASVQANLEGYGNAFAGRGDDLNAAFEALPRFFADLPPVMRVLADRDTRLGRFFAELGDAARIARPDIELIADGFAAGADTFEALARDPEALKATIEKSPAVLAVGERSFRAQRPFLEDLAAVSVDLRIAARELRGAAPVLARTLRSGIEPLRATPPLNRRLGRLLDALGDLAAAPGTDRGVAGLGETMDTLNPQLRYLGPFVTVCNYWNYWWTFLADHLTDQDGTGQVERIQAKTTDGEQADLDAFGEPQPVPGLHHQYLSTAVNDRGEADCEHGQHGYPEHLAAGLPRERRLVIDSETPGDQGTTFSGRPKVLPDQTFDRVATTAPRYRP